MNLTPYTIDINKKFMPHAEQTEVIPLRNQSPIIFDPKGNYIIHSYTDNAKVGNTHNIAVELLQHMSIVEESRKLISDGKVMTWNELINEHTAEK
mgnify:FL=1